MRACFCCELGETARLRSFMPWAVFRFLRHGMDGAGCVFAVLGGWRRRVVVLVFIDPLIPCPLGRGNMCDLRASAPPAVRGSGVSSRFPLSRGSSSCNLAARCHRLSLLASPFCSRLLVIASALPLASVPASCVLVLPLIVLLPVLAISRAGRSLLACLVRCGSRFLRLVLPPSRAPSPAFACLPSWGSSSLTALGVSLIVSCGYSVPPLVLFMSYRPPVRSFVLPVFRQAWAGSVSARCCLLALVPVVRAAGGVDRIASAGMRRRGWFVAWRGCWSAGCVRFVVSVFVYINWVLVHV